MVTPASGALVPFRNTAPDRLPTAVGNWLGGDVDVYTLHAAGSQYFNLPGDLILDFEGHPIRILLV